MDEGKSAAQKGEYKAACDKFSECMTLLMGLMPVVKSEDTKAMLKSQLDLVMDAIEGCKARLRRMKGQRTVGRKSSALEMAIMANTPIEDTTEESPTKKVDKGNSEEKRKKREFTRNKVAGEMYASERTYVTSLKVLQEVYVDPLRAASTTSLPILSIGDVQSLFATFEAVPKLNERFIKDIAARVQDWSTSQTIGDVFLTYAPFFKVYLVYVQGFEKMSQRLQELRKENERFKAFLECCELIDRHPPLQSLLIMPVQRIPRYRMLIRDMLKNTEDDHPDFPKLTEALKKIGDTAAHINTSMNRQQAALRLYEIQSAFIATKNMPPIVAPNREFVRDGPLRKLNRHGELDSLNFWLFSDVMVYGLFNVRKNAYEFRRMITPISCEVAAYKSHAHGLKVESTEKSIVIFAYAEDEQKEWLEAIKETAKRNNARNYNLRHRGSLIMKHTAAPLQGEASKSIVMKDRPGSSNLTGTS